MKHYKEFGLTPRHKRSGGRHAIFKHYKEFGLTPRHKRYGGRHAIFKHYKGFGLTPRHKRSGGRHAADVRLMTHTDISRVVNFLVNFAEDHALVLPGRVPGL